MEKILFSDVCSFLRQEFTEAPDFLLHGISIDTRTIRPGEVFLALSGENFDGHDYLPVAIKKGAVALVVSEEYEGMAEIPLLRVPDTVQALAQIAGGYRKRLPTKIIAVTGSSGKTTTKNMIAQLLSSRYKVVSTYRNYNNHIGLPLSILSLTARDEIAVLELGMNHLGEIAALTQIASPDLAVITNIGSAHLGNLGSRAMVRQAKLEVVRGLDPAKGVLVLNSDDPFLGPAPDLSWDRILYAGKEDRGQNYVWADSWEATPTGLSFVLVHQGQRAQISLPLRGAYNVNNALLATACALYLGVTPKDIQDVLASFVNENLRGEEYLFKGVTVIKDYYNANPEAMRAALETLQFHERGGKKIVILGEMNELGEFSAGEHLRLGELCRQMTDTAFFVGPSWADFAAGYGPGSSAFATKEELLPRLKEYLGQTVPQEKDVFLIKGSRGMKLEDVFLQLKKYLEKDYREEKTPDVPSTAVKLYVDAGAMRHNIRKIRDAVSPEVEIMPIVKANAYSCGTDIVVNEFRFCHYLAVADVKEAVVLQRVFPEKEIMVLYQPLAEDIPILVKYNFIVGIASGAFAQKLNDFAAPSRKVRVHLKIDTGAGRLGIAPAEVRPVAAQMKKMANIVVEGLYMHYVCADSTQPVDQEYTARQTAIFRKAIGDFEAVYGPVRFKHAGSSAAIFTQKQAHFNMVRPGFMIYGYYPSPELAQMIKLKPIYQLSTRILQLKTVPPGTAISYGRTFKTSRESVIAVVAIGYADGLSRLLSNKGFFVVNGQRAPIVGRICMDLTMLDLTEIIGAVNVGDEVFVFDNHNVTLEDIADWSETIVYEVLTRFVDKVERVERI